MDDDTNETTNSGEAVRSGAEASSTAYGCKWQHEEGEENRWWTDCGDGFEFTNDGPTENSFRFCPYCGKTLLH